MVSLRPLNSCWMGTGLMAGFECKIGENFCSKIVMRVMSKNYCACPTHKFQSAYSCFIFPSNVFKVHLCLLSHLSEQLLKKREDISGYLSSKRGQV